MVKKVTRLLPKSSGDLGDKDSLSSHLLAKIQQLDEVNMDYSWSSSSWESTLASERTILYGLTVNDELNGFSLYEISDDKVHLLKIAISEDYRGQGLGAWLLKANLTDFSEGLVKSVFLEVAANNYKAIGLYQKLGFQEYHLAKKYYSDGCDALLMSFKLLP